MIHMPDWRLLMLGSMIYGLGPNIPIGLFMTCKRLVAAACGTERKENLDSARRWALSMIPVVGPLVGYWWDRRMF